MTRSTATTWIARTRLRVWGAAEWARRGRPEVAFGFLGSLGDELLCTAPLAEWQRRGARNVWVMTRHREFFHGLARPAALLPEDARYPALCRVLGRPFHQLSYSDYDEHTDRDSRLGRHLIAEMCTRAGLQGSIQLRPYLHLAPQETAAASVHAGCIAVQSSVGAARLPMANKQWPVERFQRLVEDGVRRGRRFVQIGSAGDPPLAGVTDLRGRTSLREAAAVLHQARLFVGLTGFLMHLARAVDCPAVIVYGGREPPELTGYICNINIANRPNCAPCWQRNRCEFHRICLEAITVQEVAAAIENALARPREPLAVETAIL
jgi:hypothetical protein